MINEDFFLNVLNISSDYHIYKIIFFLIIESANPNGFYL